MLHKTFELLQKPMRFILVLRSTFELQQEPMRLILVLHSMFEQWALFSRIKQEHLSFCLWASVLLINVYVNKSLNSISSSYKAIKSLGLNHSIHMDFFYDLYELFETSNIVVS